MKLSEKKSSKLYFKKPFIQKISFTFFAYRNFIILFTFFILTFFFLFISYAEFSFTKSIRISLQNIVVPVHKVIHYPLNIFQTGSNYILNWKNAYKKADLYEKHLKEFEEKEIIYKNILKEDALLKKSLHICQEFPEKFVTSRVIAYPGRPYLKTILITGGKKNGIEERISVFASHGLVGRTVEVGETSTRVLLISDLNSRIPVIITPSNHHAIVIGDGHWGLKIKYYDKSKPIKVGEEVFTSGQGGIFLKGLKIGTVQSISGDEITVVPIMDLKCLDFVQVSLAYMSDPFLKESMNPNTTKELEKFNNLNKKSIKKPL